MKMCAFSSYFLKSCWLSVSWLGTGVRSPLVTALSVLSLCLDGHHTVCPFPCRVFSWTWERMSLDVLPQALSDYDQE